MNTNLMFCSLSLALVACGEKEVLDTAVEDTAVEETEETEETEDSQEETTETDEESVEDLSADECELIDLEASTVSLPATMEEAAQLILIPDVGESYQLVKEASSEGWFVLEVPTWMCEVELYTTESVYIELEASPDWELGDVTTPVSECEDTGLIRHSWIFHAWGSYVVHIDATDSTELWLATRMVSPTAG